MHQIFELENTSRNFILDDSLLGLMKATLFKPLKRFVFCVCIS
jgi:hypothetical protein